MAQVGMWETTTSAPVNQDSPLGPVVNGMPVDDTGTKRRQAIFDGDSVPDGAPNAETLNRIARNHDLTQKEGETDEEFAARREAGSTPRARAMRQANATIRELYRAAGQLKVHLRARKAGLVDGRVAVSFWRASKPSTRGRKANENGEE